VAIRRSWCTESTGDIAVDDAIVLTVDDDNWLFKRGTQIVEDGRIVEVRKTPEADDDVAAERVTDGDGLLATPGPVNADTHLEMTRRSVRSARWGFRTWWRT